MLLQCHQMGGGVGGRWWRWWLGVWGGGASGFTKIVHNIYVFATGNLVAPHPPTNLTKMENEFMDFKELICLLLFSVASNHRNNAIIGFVIHENLKKKRYYMIF